MAGLMGLEPTTFRVTGERSNQTELQPPHHKKDGSSGRTRTCDLTINSRMLYQLSYRGNNFKNNSIFQCFVIVTIRSFNDKFYSDLKVTNEILEVCALERYLK
jgi:hypothetical protein